MHLFVKEKSLIMIIIKHLIEILETTKIKTISRDQVKAKIQLKVKIQLNESFNVIDTLLNIYITHLFEDDYECKCITCRLKIIKI